MKKRRRKKNKIDAPIPTETPELIAEIKRRALEAILKRQLRGRPIFAGDYAFLARCEDPKEIAQPKKSIELRPLTYFQKLGEAQDMSLAALLDEVRNGKGISRSSAAKILLDKGRQEAPPKSNKTIVRFNPIGDDDETKIGT